jgi:hypothetical protein
VAYRLLIAEEARGQIRALPDDLRKNIGHRLDLLQQEFSGDIKKLRGCGIIIVCLSAVIESFLG